MQNKYDTLLSKSYMVLLNIFTFHIDILLVKCGIPIITVTFTPTSTSHESYLVIGSGVQEIFL